jgi:PiT family inorganic phosphate transporter
VTARQRSAEGASAGAVIVDNPVIVVYAQRDSEESSMEALFDHGLGAPVGALLITSLLVALAFEFVNGFHDTANAVATVIYTNTLRPGFAVTLSGLCNFAGVFVGGISVAIGIIKLLPVELLVQGGTGTSLAMVLALLLGAMIWNVGTWYFGLPASSSHTLIGAIMGVGIANSLLPGHAFGAGVNWTKATEIGLSLLVSPIFGFTLAYLLLQLVKRYTRNTALLAPPPKDVPPPPGTRALLIATSAGVSFAHGSNDGQKGVGLIMLILMGLLPADFALNPAAQDAELRETVRATETIDALLAAHGDAAARAEIDAARAQLGVVRARFSSHAHVGEIPDDARFPARQSILVADTAIESLVKSGGLGLTSDESAALKRARKALRSTTDYAPTWVLVAVALALGVGTMVGWKRIVVTVGEKIGKAHLTYAQGASAELVAASTIALSTGLGLPVSTTHVLSSGIAGTMVAQRSGLQRATVRNILLAWLMTLPASMALSGGIFLLLRALMA